MCIRDRYNESQVDHFAWSLSGSCSLDDSSYIFISSKPVSHSDSINIKVVYLTLSVIFKANVIIAFKYMIIILMQFAAICSNLRNLQNLTKIFNSHYSAIYTIFHKFMQFSESISVIYGQFL